MRRLIFLKVNHQLESRMQENCQSGSEGGAKPTFVPTPIATQKCRPVGYGVIRAGVRTDSMIGETKFRIRKLKLKHGAHLDEKYLWDALRPIIPSPTGRFFLGTLSQALRARLRSVLSLQDATEECLQMTLHDDVLRRSNAKFQPLQGTTV